jgi:uncharacterized protein (TIGR02266 family)
VHPRRALELPVLVDDTGNRVRGSIRFDARDLSLGGVFLRSDLLFEVGEELALEFKIPGGAPIRARARVVRVASDAQNAGMGISFSQMSDEDRAAVRTFLARS